MAFNYKSLSWLLETGDPGVRYLALRDLVDNPSNSELDNACYQVYKKGPISVILNKMKKEGYWSEPGPGYNPKYWSTVWSVITLAQLGASADQDKRIEKACSCLLDHAYAEGGYFTTSSAPSGTADCLQGNLCTALLDLGYEDNRLDQAFEWMAKSVTGEGVASNSDRNAKVRYFAGKCGPLFACGSNNKLSCAWGAVKVMLAFSKLPEKKRTPLIKRAIKEGVQFLLSKDPAKCDYPSGWSNKPSSNWWKFGFPVFYVTDLLQNVEALVNLGYAGDSRLKNALNIIVEKQDSQGRWLLEYDYSGKTWAEFGQKKQPNKWVTYRVLKILKAIGYKN